MYSAGIIKSNEDLYFLGINGLYVKNIETKGEIKQLFPNKSFDYIFTLNNKVFATSMDMIFEIKNEKIIPVLKIPNAQNSRILYSSKNSNESSAMCNTISVPLSVLV